VAHRPSVLLITADQHRGDCVSANAGASAHRPTVLRTPHLDRLAAEGVSFTNAYSSMPACVPARVSIMTGRIPASWGVRGNGGAVPEGMPTLPGILGANGYRTQGVGKMHFEPDFRALHGFERILVSEEGRQWKDGGDDYQAYLRRVGWEGLERGHGIGNNDARSGASPLPLEHYHTTWCTDESIAWLRRQRQEQPGQPFFLWTSFTKPHAPYDPPEPYDRLYSPFAVPDPRGGPEDLADRPLTYTRTRQRYGWDTYSDLAVKRSIAFYYGNVALIDHSVGRLLDALRELGLEEDTVVVYAADHGDLLGDHGYFFKGVFWQASWHIPLLVRAPGRLPPRGAVGRYAGLEDLLPTILRYCDIAVPHGIQGRDLFGVAAEPDAAFGTFGPQGRALHAIRTDDWTYIAHQNGGFEELYDLRADPDECRNLGGDAATEPVRARLRARLEGWLGEIGARDVLDSASHLLTRPFVDELADAEPLARTPLGMRPY
jgi:arylsulfatase